LVLRAWRWPGFSIVRPMPYSISGIMAGLIAILGVGALVVVAMRL
jgi:hypothetical protein